MVLLGHVAVSTILHCYLKTKFLPTLSGGLCPDVLDKGLCQGLKITPSGRMYGHTLTAWGLSSLAVGGVFGGATGKSWAVGYVAHLLCDLKGQVPWLFPWRGYEFQLSEPILGQLFDKFFRKTSPLETGLLLWAGVALWQRYRKLR